MIAVAREGLENKGADVEFRIDTAGLRPDLALLNAVLFSADASAQADVDHQHAELRIASNLTTGELVQVLAQAELRLDATSIRALPSVCCGGCGG